MSDYVRKRDDKKLVRPNWEPHTLRGKVDQHRQGNKARPLYHRCPHCGAGLTKEITLDTHIRLEHPQIKKEL